MDPTEKVEEVAAELADRLQSPVLTDIEIDWGDLAPTEVFPARIPDLFAGHGVRVAGRFERPGRYDIAVRGQVNGRAARLPLSIEVGEQGRADAVGLTWARAAIADAMEQTSFPVEFRDDRVSDDAIRRRVTELGLDFSLVTRWTSFVAVSENVVNTSPESTVDAAVPVPMVDGVSPLAYHPAPAPVAAAAPVYNGAIGGASSSRFSGSGAPEPATVTGLLVSAGAGIAALRRRRRARAAD
jgi:Ca-activated chloride channel homolog